MLNEVTGLGVDEAEARELVDRSSVNYPVKVTHNC
jgi:hypothetical protein